MQTVRDTIRHLDLEKLGPKEKNSRLRSLIYAALEAVTTEAGPDIANRLKYIQLARSSLESGLTEVSLKHVSAAVQDGETSPPAKSD
jgi:hypothetical protein